MGVVGPISKRAVPVSRYRCLVTSIWRVQTSATEQSRHQLVKLLVCSLLNVFYLVLEVWCSTAEKICLVVWADKAAGETPRRLCVPRQFARSVGKKPAGLSSLPTTEQPSAWHFLVYTASSLVWMLSTALIICVLFAERASGGAKNSCGSVTSVDRLDRLIQCPPQPRKTKLQSRRELAHTERKHHAQHNSREELFENLQYGQVKRPFTQPVT